MGYSLLTAVVTTCFCKEALGVSICLGGRFSVFGERFSSGVILMAERSQAGPNIMCSGNSSFCSTCGVRLRRKQGLCARLSHRMD